MQTSTPAKRRATVKRAPTIPFPDLPDAAGTPAAIFWRAAWLRSQATREALRAHTLRVYNQRQTTEALRYAFAAAEGVLIGETREDFKHLLAAGGLLYAWLPEGGVA